MEPKPLTFPARTAAGGTPAAAFLFGEYHAYGKGLRSQAPRVAEPSGAADDAAAWRALRLEDSEPGAPGRSRDADRSGSRHHQRLFDRRHRARAPLTNRPPPEDKPVARPDHRRRSSGAGPDRARQGDRQRHRQRSALPRPYGGLPAPEAAGMDDLGRPVRRHHRHDLAVRRRRRPTRSRSPTRRSWADETRTAYQKGTTGFFGKKPAFYEQMLTNARDILQTLALEIDQHKRLLVEKLEPLQDRYPGASRSAPRD
jgi:hypothetical protein